MDDAPPVVGEEQVHEQHTRFQMDTPSTQPQWPVGYSGRTSQVVATGSAATLTYGNGVLVVALPIAERTRAARLTLEPLSATRGERAGSPGHPAHRPATE